MKAGRRCPQCRRWVPVEEFPRNRSTSSGLAAYCKPCHNRIGRANREKNHGTVRNFMLKHRYGVDEVQVEWMKLGQGGLCAICAVRPAVHVDHDHETGFVRGILCFNCNRALGKLGDDASLLAGAVEYLEKATT